MQVSDSDADRVRSVLATLPAAVVGRSLAVEDQGSTPSITRLGGLTNRVYRVGDVVVRLPGLGTERYIDRENEAVAAIAFGDAGVSPPVLAVDSDTGLLAIGYLRGTTMTPQLFSTRPGALSRAARVLLEVHTSGVELPASFDAFAILDGYLATLAESWTRATPTGLSQALASAASIRQALAAAHLPRVACHCDPVSENFLDDGARMWLLDWEYSGMSDPVWDLADLSVEAELEDAGQRELLRAYFGAEPSAPDYGRFLLYRAASDLLWSVWGLLQVLQDNPVDDFYAYYQRRLGRFRGAVSSPAFSDALQVAVAG